MEKMKVKTVKPLVWCMAALLAVVPASVVGQSAVSDSDVAALKAQLAEQQKQIDMLKLALEDQKKLLERISGTTTSQAPASQASASQDFTVPRKTLGEVASATPVIPSAPSSSSAPAAPLPSSVLNAVQPQPPAGASTNPCEAVPDGQAPAFFRLGSTCLVPIGFMDATFVWRDKNSGGSGIGSNFGNIPYNNVVNGKLGESRFSPQNSRIGFRFDGDWKGAHFIGYNEFDFLGTSGSNAITVTNGGFVPRLRLYWVDVRKNKIEFLAGQSWSMLTPNRKGISALPGDIFYSQVMDVNYMAGLTWTRQPGMRVLFHPSDTVTFGFSLENPDQYIGGSAGGSGITLPAASTLAGLSGTQLDAGNINYSTPTLTPDFIAKVAFDPSSRFHAEVTGLERNFKIINPANLALGVTSTKAGAGIQVGLNGEIFKGFRLISTNYWSDGGGRYLFGQAPDLVVRADGTISLMHSGGTVDGFESTFGKWLLFGYYGGIYIPRDVAIDTTGARIGYGYIGSPNSQNKAIQEATFGFNRTMWRDPRYGAINVIGQWEYLTRDPWFVAAGAPKATHDNTIFFDIRYTLPGSMPPF
jgi:hypothetical protein